MAVGSEVVKVSIISVVFNARSELERTIQSVLNQTSSNFEYIVVDGGSTDGTVSVLEGYRDAGCLKFVSEPDRGIYDAINKGICLASGEYVNVLMMGDFHECDFVERIEIHAESNDFLFTGWSVWFGADRRKVVTGRALPSLASVRGMPFPHNSLVVKREICVKRPYSLNFRYASDFEFICFLLKESYVGVSIERPLTNYCVGGVGNSYRSLFETFKILCFYRILNFSNAITLAKQFLMTMKIKNL